MLFQVLKDVLANQAEYRKHRHFMDMGIYRIDEKANRLIVRYSPFQSAFLLLLTFAFGPVLGLALLSGQLDLTDAPVWVNALCILLPFVMFAWMIQVLRTQIFSHPECVFDATLKQITLKNPASREHYPGKKWPERVRLTDILGFEIRHFDVGKGGKAWSLLINLDEEAFLILLTAQSQKTIERIRNFLLTRMQMTELEAGYAHRHLRKDSPSDQASPLP